MLDMNNQRAGYVTVGQESKGPTHHCLSLVQPEVSSSMADWTRVTRKPPSWAAFRRNQLRRNSILYVL